MSGRRGFQTLVIETCLFSMLCCIIFSISVIAVRNESEDRMCGGWLPIDGPFCSSCYSFLLLAGGPVLGGEPGPFGQHRHGVLCL